MIHMEMLMGRDIFVTLPVEASVFRYESLFFSLISI